MISHAESDTVHPLWEKVRRHLETMRRPIQDEIRRYPPPIPACDAHFNHLLEQRALLSRELIRLETASRDESASVEDFVRSSPCIDEAVAGTLLEDGDRAR
jgi:hypothetical protein